MVLDQYIMSFWGFVMKGKEVISGQSLGTPRKKITSVFKEVTLLLNQNVGQGKNYYNVGWYSG